MTDQEFRSRSFRNLYRYEDLLRNPKPPAAERRRILAKWLSEVGNTLKPDELEQILYFIYTHVREYPIAEAALHRPGIEDREPTMYREKYNGFLWEEVKR